MGSTEELWNCIAKLQRKEIYSMGGIPFEISYMTNDMIVIDDLDEDALSNDQVEISRDALERLLGLVQAAIDYKVTHGTWSRHLLQLKHEDGLKDRIDKIIARNLRAALYKHGKTPHDIFEAFGLKSATAIRNVLVGRDSSLHAADLVVFSEQWGIAPVEILEGSEKAFDRRRYKGYMSNPYNDRLAESVQFFMQSMEGNTADDVTPALEMVCHLMSRLTPEGFRQLITVIYKTVGHAKNQTVIDDLESLLEFLMKRRKPVPSFDELYKIAEIWGEMGKEQFWQCINEYQDKQGS